MQGNVLGQSGGSSSSGLNVYAQLAEPSKKDGVWIKTEKTVIDDIIYEKLKNIPHGFWGGSVITIGTDIYIFGASYSSIYGKYAYKYNTLTNEYTQLTDIPYNFYYGSAVAIGTDIYILGGNNSKKCTYKYNALTDTYTRLIDIPYNFYSGSAVSIGTDIYLFGGEGSKNIAYKYNTLTNEYIQLTDIPYEFYWGSAVVVDTNIYLFGSYSGNYQKYVYRYDILTNEYTQITDIPYNFYQGSAVSIGTNVYLFGSNSTSYQQYAYKVPISILPEITKYKYDKVELVEDIKSILEEIYIKNNKTIFIETKLTFNTKLTKMLQIGFSNANIYDNNSLLGYLVYYGNGQEWIKIENN